MADALVVHPAAESGITRDQRSNMGAESHRYFCARSPGARRTEAFPGSGQDHVAAPGHAGSYGAAANDRRDRRLPLGFHAERLRQSYRSAAAIAARITNRAKVT